jgi:predicted alpha/beta superfamily hydrolase
MHVLASAYFEEQLLITVALPMSYGATDQTYPVLYMMDGNFEFPIGAMLAPLLAYGQEAPEVIVVGIGYAVTDIAQIISLRWRDLPPTVTDEGGGGADNLILFIEEELKPFIAENYRVDPENEILFGHSLAGLFATYSLFQAPDGFKYYIIGSPAYQWDEEVVFSYEEAYATDNSSLAARVFFGIGALETERLLLTEQMAQTLLGRDYPGLEIEVYVFQDGMHFSTLGGTIGQGLMWVLSVP